MELEVNWYDDDESRVALRAVALDTLERLIATESLALSLPVDRRRVLRHLGQGSVEELVANRTAEKVLQSNERLRFESLRDAATAVTGELPAMVDGMPEFVAEVEILLRRAFGDGTSTPDEAKARAVSKLLENLDRVVSPLPYFNVTVANERRGLVREMLTSGPDVEPWTAESADGEEYEEAERSTRNRPPEPGEIVVAQALLDDAACRIEACPVCESEPTRCPDDVESSWWVSEARGGRPAHQIVALGRKRCAFYRGSSPNAAEQRFSRYGFHATGTLLHVFALAEDRRLGDYHLLDLGRRNHGKRYSDLLSMNKRRVTPAAACCAEIEFWCAEQVSRLGRGGSVDHVSFPFPNAQHDEVG
jgi:hypothetical protein